MLEEAGLLAGGLREGRAEWARRLAAAKVQTSTQHIAVDGGGEAIEGDKAATDAASALNPQ